MSVQSTWSFNYGPDAKMEVTGIWTAPTGSDTLGTPSIKVVIKPDDIAWEGNASLTEQEPGIRQELFARALGFYKTLLGNPQTWEGSFAMAIHACYMVRPRRGFNRIHTEALSYISPTGPLDPSAFALLVSDWSNPGIYLHPDQASEIQTKEGSTVKASEVVQKVRQLCSTDEAEPQVAELCRLPGGKRFDVRREKSPSGRPYSYNERYQHPLLSEKENDTKWQELVRTATRVALDYYELREVYGPSVTLVPAKDSTLYPTMSPRDETLYDFPEP